MELERAALDTRPTFPYFTKYGNIKHHRELFRPGPGDASGGLSPAGAAGTGWPPRRRDRTAVVGATCHDVGTSRRSVAGRPGGFPSPGALDHLSGEPEPHAGSHPFSGARLLRGASRGV